MKKQARKPKGRRMPLLKSAQPSIRRTRRALEKTWKGAVGSLDSAGSELHSLTRRLVQKSGVDTHRAVAAAKGWLDSLEAYLAPPSSSRRRHAA
jgi:hypothetical protein